MLEVIIGTGLGFVLTDGIGLIGDIGGTSSGMSSSPNTEPGSRGIRSGSGWSSGREGTV